MEELPANFADNLLKYEIALEVGRYVDITLIQKLMQLYVVKNILYIFNCQ